MEEERAGSAAVGSEVVILIWYKQNPRTGLSWWLRLCRREALVVWGWHDDRHGRSGYKHLFSSPDTSSFPHLIPHAQCTWACAGGTGPT